MGEEGGEAACYLAYADTAGDIRTARDRLAADLPPTLSLRIPVRSPLDSARYWAAVLGALVEGGNRDTASVVDPSGRLPRLLFFEGAPAPGIQLDLTVPDLAAAVGHCQSLGGRLLESFPSHALLADPEGYHLHLHS